MYFHVDVNWFISDILLRFTTVPTEKKHKKTVKSLICTRNQMRRLKSHVVIKYYTYVLFLNHKTNLFAWLPEGLWRLLEASPVIDSGLWKKL